MVKGVNRVWEVQIYVLKAVVFADDDEKPLALSWVIRKWDDLNHYLAASKISQRMKQKAKMNEIITAAVGQVRSLGSFISFSLWFGLSISNMKERRRAPKH
jgi:hypothetical protein